MPNDFHDAFAYDGSSSSLDSDYAFQELRSQKLPVDTPKIVSDTHPKSGIVEDYLWRGVVGGAEKAFTGIAETASDLHDFVTGNILRTMGDFDVAVAQKMGLEGLPTMTYKDGKIGFGYALSGKETLAGSMDQFLRDRGAFDTAVPDAERGGAKLVSGITAFAIPMSKLKAGMETAEVFANWGKIAGLSRDIAASAGAAFASWHPLEGNLANVASDFGLDKSAVAEWTHVDTLIDGLKVNPDDGQIEARLKNTVADFATNLALTGAVDVVAKSIKAVRAGNVFRRVAEATDEADKIVVPSGQTPIHVDAAETALQHSVEPVQGELFADKEIVTKPVAVDTVDKMLADIDTRGAKFTEAEIEDLAKQWQAGVPYGGIELIGVNPARLDMGKWLAEHTDPVAAKGAVDDLLNRISSSEIGQRLAGAMGSSPRTDTAAAFLAKMVGSNVTEIVSALKDKTRNMDVYVRAGSALVGGETQKLVTYAERLQDLIAKGEFDFASPSHPAYVDFLKQFETLTVLQSAMRGSFSEMGRGLRSIQLVNAARSGKADIELAKSVVKDPNATGKAAKAVASWEDKLRNLSDAKTPAQRKALFDQVMKAKGDLSQVAKNVASGEGTPLARAARWMRETSANLFSIGTASATAGGMMTYHGIDLLAGVFHKPIGAVFKNDEFVIAGMVNDAKWSTLSAGYWNGLKRAVQVGVSELVREVGRAAEGVGGAAGAKNALRFETAAKQVEDFIGTKWKPASADKFGKSVADAVHVKFDREAIAADPAIYLKASDWETIAASENHGAAFFSAFSRAVVGTVVNTFGAVTRAGRIGTITFLDELTGSAVYGTHKYAEAIGVAARQGIAQGLEGKALKTYAEKTARDLVANTSRDKSIELQALIEAGSGDVDRIEALAKDVIQRHGIEEIAQADARRILFQDELTTGIGKGLKKIGSYDKAGIIAPFVHTPLRILETGLMDFSPLGLLKKELRANLMSPGPKQTEALIKMGMGTMVMMLGYSAAASGNAVGYDGGFKSSARLGRPQYSSKIGDHWVEYGRIDPLATMIGIGADLYQFQKQLEASDMSGDESANAALSRLAEAGWLTLVENVLSKSYLQGLKNVSMLFDADTSSTGISMLASGLEQRFVPVGGLQKGITSEVTDRMAHTADPSSIWNQLKNQYIASTFFAPMALHDRRDPFLGQPVTYDRTLGIKDAAHEHDPLMREMENLSFNMPKMPRSVGGVTLTADQQHQLLATMGDSKLGGKTLADTLRGYVMSPEWKGYTSDQKVQIMKTVRQPYYELAKEKLKLNDPQLLRDTAAMQFQKALISAGAPREQVKADVKSFKEKLDKE